MQPDFQKHSERESSLDGSIYIVTLANSQTMLELDPVKVKRRPGQGEVWQEFFFCSPVKALKYTY